ncbi:MAG: 23S rRNA (adenine(2503)-C(2))-methyltransferase RlmN [Terriglobales bacterium]
MDRPKIDILGLSIEELNTIVEDLGQPPYRAKQLFQAMYRERALGLEQVSTLPAELKARMQERGLTFKLPALQKKFVSVDGTVRYLLEYADGQSVETVWMPEGDGGEAGDGTEAGDEEAPARSKPVRSRATICVSSQVGCAVNCQFCMTALLGLKRNLTAGEIVGQVMVALNDHKVDVTKKRINLVFMGQGEPFHNYDNFIKAVRLLVEGVGLPETRMTVSTSGIVPRIADLGKETIRPKLAISLNASNDAERTKLIPINKKWNIAALMEAAKQYPLRRREKVTFEYVLLDHENDSPENAHEVVELLRDVPAKVNLIAWNSGPEIAFATPSDERVLAFQKILREADIPTYIRRPRGRDIYAACGQLKRTAS